MFIIPSIDLSMKLSLLEVFISNIIVTMVISNKSCCKHVLFRNLSDFISTTTRVTSVKSKKFLFCSFSVAKFGIALEKGERTHSYTLFIFVYRWQLCNMFVNSCWYILAWFSVQHMPSLHNAACCVSNFGVLESQQKFNCYNSFITLTSKHLLVHISFLSQLLYFISTNSMLWIE